MTETTLAAPESRPNKGLHIAVWVVQILLALAFGAAGLMKSTAPLDELGKNMAWVARSAPALVRFIGVAELLGAIGLILPALTRIKPVLTPVAALGLVVIMVLAAGVHVANTEPGLAINAAFGALAAFVAWGRLKKAPIAPRG